MEAAWSAAAQVGGHVGDHHIHRIAVDRLKDLLKDAVFSEIPLNEGHIGETVHRQNIGCDHLSAGSHQAGGNLRPAAGGGPKVDHQHAGPDQFVFFVNLQQLVAGAGTVAILLCLFDEGIINVLIEPACTAFGTGHTDCKPPVTEKVQLYVPKPGSVMRRAAATDFNSADRYNSASFDLCRVC